MQQHLVAYQTLRGAKCPTDRALSAFVPLQHPKANLVGAPGFNFLCLDFEEYTINHNLLIAGTIVGSAVFNILFVIAACAFAAKEALR